MFRAGLLAAVVTGCTAIVHTDVTASGIGGSCGGNDACQAGECRDGVCTAKCASNADCPAPTACQPDGYCAMPMKVGYLYIGVLADQGWSYMQDQGRLDAQKNRPWLTSEYRTNVITDDDVTKNGEELIKGGANVVIQSSQGGVKPMTDLATKYPNVKFLQLYNNSLNPKTPNMGDYWVQIQQSWYIAGYVAAKRSKTNHIAWIGGFVSPQGVVRANGFIRGAQKANPDIQVEIRWVGFWFDPGNPVNGKYREEVNASAAIDSGADVIMANLDNERAYDIVEGARAGGKDVWSIETNNPASCAKYPRSCLGVAWLNWAPIYSQQLDLIHSNRWAPAYVHPNLLVDATQSTVGFTASTVNGLDTNTSIELDTIRGKLADDIGYALRGPYETTGQRAAVGDGEQISEEELLKMCWLAKGAVERTDPNDPTSAMRPAQVPSGDRTFLDRKNMPAGAESLADPPNCLNNL